MRDAGLTFVRLLRFARPYVGVVVLALLFSLAYAGGRSLRAYLMKPLMDEVLIPAGDVAQGQDFGWALLGMGEDEGPEPTPGDGAAATPSLDDQAGAAHFRTSLAGVQFGYGGVAFNATVILKSGEETLKVSGFQYPF